MNRTANREAKQSARIALRAMPVVVLFAALGSGVETVLRSLTAEDAAAVASVRAAAQPARRRQVFTLAARQTAGRVALGSVVGSTEVAGADTACGPCSSGAPVPAHGSTAVTR